MLRPGILDNAGKATTKALHTLGFENVNDVKIGKMITITCNENDIEQIFYESDQGDRVRYFVDVYYDVMIPSSGDSEKDRIVNNFSQYAKWLEEQNAAQQKVQQELLQKQVEEKMKRTKAPAPRRKKKAKK